jgi:hypothetical protein
MSPERQSLLPLRASQEAQESPVCPVEGCPGPDMSHDGAAVGCGLERDGEECEA